MVALDEDIASTEVKKPRLRDEDELNLFKTPEKLLSPMDSAKNNFVQNPPPTCHSFNRRRTSELLCYNASYYSLYEKSKEKYIYFYHLYNCFRNFN